MLANLVFLLGVGAIAFVWGARGAFSSLLHLVATIIGGAVAFGVWEPLGAAVLDNLPGGDAGLGVEAIAWTASLLLPFAITTIVCRVIIDAVVRGNMKQSAAVEFVGGGLAGACSGVITVGLVAIGLGYARLPVGFLGYEPTGRSDSGGSLVARSPLWIPVDSITASFYRFMSLNSLNTGEPLARWHPHLEHTGFASRLNFENGKTRNNAAPDTFTIKGRYRVGTPEQALPADQLAVKFRSDREFSYVDIKNEPVSQGYIEGVVVEFKAEAKERNGAFVFSNGQVWLLVEDTQTGATTSVFPLSLVSKGDAVDADSFNRWSFDSKVDIASPGGASTFIAGFEFLVPPNHRAIAVYVKNSRIKLDPAQPDVTTFRNSRERDSRLRNVVENLRSTPSASGDGAPQLLPDRIRIDPASITSSIALAGSWSIAMTDALGQVFNRETRGGLDIDDENNITGGDHKLSKIDLGRVPTGPDGRKLRVDSFKTADDRVMIQVNIARNSDLFAEELLSRFKLGRGDEISLVDAEGEIYRPVGFVYHNKSNDGFMHIRFIPSQPIASFADFYDIIGDTLGTFRDDQDARLLFEVSTGARLRFLQIGNKRVAEITGGGFQATGKR